MILRRNLSVSWALLALLGLGGWRVFLPGSDRPVLHVSWEGGEWALSHPEFVEIPLGLKILRCPRAGPCPPRLSVHLRSGAGELVRTFDHLPSPRCGQSSRRHLLRVFQAAGSESLPPGRYELSLGAYLAERRFRIRGPEGPVERLVLGRVVVPADGRGTEHVAEFAGGWEPRDRPEDLQYPASRWFHGRARIELDPAPVPRTVLVHAGVPFQPGEAGAGRAEDRIAIRSSCTEEILHLHRPGLHRRTLSIPADRPCAIHFEGGNGRSGYLAALAWRLDAP